MTLLLVLLLALTVVLVVWTMYRRRARRRPAAPVPRRLRPGLRRRLAGLPTRADGQFRDLKVGRQRRSYLYFRPEGQSLTTPLPLVVVFHGGFGNPLSLAQRTGLNEAAARHGFAVAYPAARGHWEDGRETTGRGTADLDFVAALIEHIEATGDINRRRRYAIGVSNGGMFVFRLTIDAPKLFTAYSANLASLPVTLVDDMANAPPVPLMMMNAVEDQLTPWRGGIAGGEYGVGGHIISIEDAVGLWRMRNHCGPPSVEPLWRAPADVAVAAELQIFQAKPPEGAELRLLKLLQGGHRWPRAPFFKASVTDGPLVEVLAADLIWSFLSVHVSGEVAEPRIATPAPGRLPAP